jgi:hypothetical protein
MYTTPMKTRGNWDSRYCRKTSLKKPNVERPNVEQGKMDRTQNATKGRNYNFRGRRPRNERARKGVG